MPNQCFTDFSLKQSIYKSIRLYKLSISKCLILSKGEPSDPTDQNTDVNFFLQLLFFLVDFFYEIVNKLIPMHYYKLVCSTFQFKKLIKWRSFHFTLGEHSSVLTCSNFMDINEVQRSKHLHISFPFFHLMSFITAFELSKLFCMTAGNIRSLKHSSYLHYTTSQSFSGLMHATS